MPRKSSCLNVYLCNGKGRQTTSIGVLLGVAASHMCSCDTVISKTLYLHIPSLIPRSSSSEIEVPVIVQCAAITGLGLLYCGSGNRSMAEFLLSELHRRPPCEKGTDSGEAFALSAAWALGMVCIGRGGIGTPNLDGSTVSNFSPASVDIFDSLHDLKLDERLLRCITGEMGSLGESDFKAKQSGKGIFANSYTNDSSTRGLLVLEPEGLVNTVFTSFGAIIALALIFIHSNSESIASRLRPPSTCFGLETERPDLLCMRSLAVRLINWTETENVCSSTSTARDVATWLENQVPEVRSDLLYMRILL
jgi:anaphase-promoting complex subunit 1